MPRQGQYTEAEIKGMLDAYVTPKECGSTMFPRDLKPRSVSDYIAGSVTAEFRALPMKRAARLVRFYVLRDRIEQLSSFIAGGEKTRADLERTCSIVVAAGELGSPEQQGAVVKEFQRLVNERVARNAFDVLIETFFSLPPNAPADPLKKRIRAALDECQKKGPETDLGTLMNYDIRELPWAVEEKARKDGLAWIKEDDVRRRKWAEAYLGFDQKTPFRWEEQAGFGFLADVRGAGDKPAVDALTAAMTRIDPSKDDRELVQIRKTRGYRARQYFLEQLDEEQMEDRQANLHPQDDLIM